MDKRISAALCATTVFLGAFLLFLVQPLVSKAILPLYGGTSAVWSTCMLVFQWLLFGGYCYSHLLDKFCNSKWQTVCHGGVLVASLLALPILPQDFRVIVGNELPELQIIRFLCQTIALPFFVLATTGPLVQTWWSKRVSHESPIRLYSLSNLGSLLALISYPFFVEPNFSIQQQSRIWGWGFFFYVAACGGLLVVVAKFPIRFREISDIPRKDVGNRVQIRRSLELLAGKNISMWFVLGFIPSLMLLATTQQLCLDMAAVPFLWILQLAIYLLSFILCFSHPRWCSRRFWSVAFLLSAVGLVVLLGSLDFPIWIQAAICSCGLMTCCMLCHGELAKLAPEPEQLTLYYLVMSAAGALGGTFAGLVAPLVFNSLVELPLAIFATCLLLLFLLRSSPLPFSVSWKKKIHDAVLLFGVFGIFGGLIRNANSLDGTQLESTRTFYGVLHVVECDRESPALARREFRHGRIVHGLQYLAGEKRDLPTIYYQKNTGVGLVLRTHHADRPRKIGAIGLGVGTIASYGNALDSLRFYEIDPEVERLARKYFSYLKDSRAECSVVFGDARVNLDLSLRENRRENFDVLVVDAFSGDAIPMHLLTREAIAVYLGHLNSKGILAFHISNRHFNLRRVLAASAARENLKSRVINTRGICEWVLMSRSEESFPHEVWHTYPTLAGTKEVPWTDSFGSLAQILRPEAFRWRSDENLVFDELIGKSVGKLSAGDVDGAESGFREALKINDREPVAWRHLGNLLRQTKRTSEALLCFQQVVELNPTDADAWITLGQLVSTTEPENAEKFYRSAIRMEPNNAGHHQQLADQLLQNGKRAEAIRHYEKALEISPNSEIVRRRLEQARKQVE